MGKSIKHNLLYSTFYQLLVMIIPLITSPYLSRVLGPENIGIYSETNAFAYYFFIIAMLGVNNYGNREVSKTRDNKEKLSDTFWQIYYIQFFLTIVTSLCYIILIVFIIKKNVIIYFLQLFYVLSALFDINWFAFGMEEFKLTTIRSTFIKIVNTLLIFLLVKNSEDLIIYTLIMVLGNIFGLFMVWPLVSKYTYFRKPIFKLIIHHLKPNIVLFIPLVASSMYQYMDKILIGIFVNSKEVGFYNYAQNIISLSTSLMLGFTNVLMPRMSNMVIYNKEKSLKMVEKSIKYTTVLNIGVMFGLISISSEFIPLYLGKEYMYTALLLQILTISIPISGFANILRTTYLIPFKKDYIYVKSIIYGSIVDIVTNILLLPIISAVGSCIASILTYFTISFFQCFDTRKELNYNKYLLNCVIFLFIGLFMFLVVSMLKGCTSSEILSIIIRIIAGVFVYSILSIIVLFIQKDMYLINIIKRLFKREE